uniref:Ig-like domain-containing protein n=1 Tax=Seriola lalandi dorsalis TaxID=1841481 RepID=A0A3B4YHW9_SERLL
NCSFWHFSVGFFCLKENQALVHQSGSETIQPGGSVTLSCTVHTGTCDGEHSVYWFKDSEESHPGLIYTHGDRNDQCERKPETQTQTCVYNLPMENLNRSHAGTYYCAVASCGHILFGNGTKLDVEGESLFYFVNVCVCLCACVHPQIYKCIYIFLCFHVCETFCKLVFETCLINKVKIINKIR